MALPVSTKKHRTESNEDQDSTLGKPSPLVSSAVQVGADFRDLEYVTCNGCAVEVRIRCADDWRDCVSCVRARSNATNEEDSGAVSDDAEEEREREREQLKRRPLPDIKLFCRACASMCLHRVRSFEATVASLHGEDMETDDPGSWEWVCEECAVQDLLTNSILA